MSDSALVSLDGVERHVLSNGLVVLLRRDRSAPVVSIVTWVRAGYFDEPDEVAGISHVLEHMYFKGTARRGVGQLARETKGSGGYLNAHTTYDHTAYFTVIPAASLELGMDLQSDAYANSALDAAELARELEVIIQEARRKEDNASAVASEALFAMLHDRHRIRRWRIGSESGLRSLTSDAVRDFYRTYYRPSNTILVIVGDVPQSEMLRLAELYYGSLPDAEVVRDHGPAEVTLPGFRYEQRGGDVSQAQLLFGWRAPPMLVPDSVALDMWARLLSSGRASRFQKAVRDQKLVSSIRASNYSQQELGIFSVHAELDPNCITDAAKAIWGVLGAIESHPPDAGDLARACSAHAARTLRSLESMDGQAMWLASWEAAGDWQLGLRYSEDLAALSSNDLVSAAKRWLIADQSSVFLYSPEGVEAPVTSTDNLRQLLDSAQVVAPSPSEPSVHFGVSVSRPVRLEKIVAGAHLFRSVSGVPVIARRRADAALAYVGLDFRGGVLDEDSHRRGQTALMARTLLRGSTAHGDRQLAEELERLGAVISPSVRVEGFGWQLSVPQRNLRDALRLLAEVVQYPAFHEEEFESERASQLGTITLALDDMSGRPVRLGYMAAYGGHPYGLSPLGKAESVAGLLRDDIEEWHDARVPSAEVVIGVVGDAAEAELAELAASFFPNLVMGETRHVPAPEWQSGAVGLETRDKKQTALALLFPSASAGDDARYTAALISTLTSGLGGRFFDELRDKQSLAYTVSTSSQSRSLGGAFVGYIATSPEKEDVAIAGMLREFERLASDEVTPDELVRAREYYMGTRDIRQQSGGNVLGELLAAWHYGGGLESLQVEEKVVRSITAADIRAFAAAHFVPELCVRGIVRGSATG